MCSGYESSYLIKNGYVTAQIMFLTTNIKQCMNVAKSFYQFWKGVSMETNGPPGSATALYCIIIYNFYCNVAGCGKTGLVCTRIEIYFIAHVLPWTTMYSQAYWFLAIQNA